jgi:hypothetical protein
MTSHGKNATLAKVIGQAILLASIQASLGSVLMSSRFSVLSFAKDQDTLQRAADALSSYLAIGSIWAAGTILILYAEFGIRGLIAAIICNILMIGWIFWDYWRAFQEASNRHGLDMPILFISINGEQPIEKYYVTKESYNFSKGLYAKQMQQQNAQNKAI